MQFLKFCFPRFRIMRFSFAKDTQLFLLRILLVIRPGFVLSSKFVEFFLIENFNEFFLFFKNYSIICRVSLILIALELANLFSN